MLIKMKKQVTIFTSLALMLILSISGVRAQDNKPIAFTHVNLIPMNTKFELRPILLYLDLLFFIHDLNRTTLDVFYFQMPFITIRDYDT